VITQTNNQNNQMKQRPGGVVTPTASPAHNIVETQKEPNRKRGEDNVSGAKAERVKGSRKGSGTSKTKITRISVHFKYLMPRCPHLIFLFLFFSLSSDSITKIKNKAKSSIDIFFFVRLRSRRLQLHSQPIQVGVRLSEFLLSGLGRGACSLAGLLG